MCVAIVACSMDKVHATRVRLTHIENGVICGTNPQSAYREPFSNGSRVVQVQLAPRGLRQKRRVNGVTFGSKENAFSLLDKTSGDRSQVARCNSCLAGCEKLDLLSILV